MKTKLAVIIAALWMQPGFSINPLKEYKVRPEKLKIEYQELKLKTPDQYELNTWIMEPNGEQDKNLTVVFVLFADGGGSCTIVNNQRLTAALKPIYGRDKVSRLLARAMPKLYKYVQMDWTYSKGWIVSSEIFRTRGAHK